MLSVAEVAADSAQPDQSVCLGRIGAPFGIKGWVKLISFTQPIDNLLLYKEFVIRHQEGQVTLVMDDSQPHGKGLIAHFVGYDTPEQVRELTNVELRVAAAVLPELAPGEFYWHQLTGLRVVNAEGVELGIVSRLLETGANDVLVVDPSADSVDKHQRLLPWLPDQVILKVDLQAGIIHVDWGVDYLI